MKDLAEFTITRPPRRVEPTTEEHLLLMSPLVRMVAQFLGQGAEPSDTAISNLLTTFKDDSAHSVQAVASPDTAQQYLISLVHGIEIWLAQKEDLVTGADLKEKVGQAAADFMAHYDPPTWNDALLVCPKFGWMDLGLAL